MECEENHRTFFVEFHFIFTSQAVEAYRNPRGASEKFAKPLLLHGCLKIPMGNLTKVRIPKPQIASAAKMDWGQPLKNCGLPRACSPGEFSLRVYTGKDMKDEPKICFQVNLNRRRNRCCCCCFYCHEDVPFAKILKGVFLSPQQQQLKDGLPHHVLSRVDT